MDIPWQSLQPDTLRRLVEAFITREGTDYGHVTYTLDQKVDQVLVLLKKGEAKITYDAESETCNIVNT